MRNVNPFPGRAMADSPQQQLTSAHRFLMYAIQDLTMDISMLTDHKASCDYSGHVHTLTVDVVPPEHLAAPGNGDGSFKTCYSRYLHLPPCRFAEPDSLQQLGQIITELQRYLPPSHTPGGAA